MCFCDEGVSSSEFDRARLNALRQTLTQRPLPFRRLLVTDTRPIVNRAREEAPIVANTPAKGQIGP